MTSASIPLELQHEVEQFFYLESDLLDERRFREWLDLLHPDLNYAMPLRRNVHSQNTVDEFTTAGRDIMWFDEGKSTLEKRIVQLETGEHWAEEPVSRVSHLVTNVRILGFDSTGVEVSSRFLVYRNRVETEGNTWIGRRRDTLARENGQLLLRDRLILLDQSTLIAKNLTVFF